MSRAVGGGGGVGFLGGFGFGFSFGFGFDFGFRSSCEAAPNQVLECDDRGLLWRGYVEVKIGEGDAKTDGDMEGRRRWREEQRRRAAREERSCIWPWI